MNSSTKTLVRIVAGYPLYESLGENNEAVGGTQIMTNFLQEAKDAEEIVDFKVLDCTTGAMSIEYVTFTIDLDFESNASWEQVKKRASYLLEQVIKDADVEIHWAGFSD